MRGKSPINELRYSACSLSVCGNKCRTPLKSHHMCGYWAVCAHLPFSTFLPRDPKPVIPLQLHLLYVFPEVPGFFLAPSEWLGLFHLPTGFSSLPNAIASFCSNIPYLCNGSQVVTESLISEYRVIHTEWYLCSRYVSRSFMFLIWMSWRPQKHMLALIHSLLPTYSALSFHSPCDLSHTMERQSPSPLLTPFIMFQVKPGSLLQWLSGYMYWAHLFDLEMKPLAWDFWVPLTPRKTQLTPLIEAQGLPENDLASLRLCLAQGYMQSPKHTLSS